MDRVKVRKRFPLCMVPAWIFLCWSIQGAPLLSEANRLQLNGDVLRAMRDCHFDSARTAFYSLPGELTDLPKDGLLMYGLGKGKAVADLDFTWGSKLVDSRQIGFFSWGGVALYQQSNLEMLVRANTYTIPFVSSQWMDEYRSHRLLSNDEPPISGMFNFDFNMPVAYVKLKLDNIHLLSGRQKIRWGPGYKGTLGMSGTTSTPFCFYHLQAKLGKRFHFSSFLAGLDDQRFFEAAYPELDTVPHPMLNWSKSRFGAGNRIDARFGDLQIAFFEYADFSEIGNLSTYANPVQLYFLAQNSGLSEVNQLVGLDFNLSLGNFRLYGEGLNDDITALDHSGNPSKYAFQLGAVRYFQGKLSQIGIEYTHLSRYLYGHYTVVNQHGFWGESRGWPWGNKQDVLIGHGHYRARDNLHFHGEIGLWMKGRGSIDDDWGRDGSPDLDRDSFLPEDGIRITTLLVSAQYLPKEWLDIDLHYRPLYAENSIEQTVAVTLRTRIPASYSIADAK